MLRWPWCATTLHAAEAGEISSDEIWRLHDFPGHRRHAMQDRDTFTLDQFQRSLCIPFMHHHELALIDKTCEELRMTAGHVKERHVSEQCGLIGRVVLAQLWSQYFIDFFYKFPGKKSTDDAAMRRQHAFGMAGGTGGVHDGRVVFRRNPKCFEVGFLQRFTAGYQAMNFRGGRVGTRRPH